MGRGRASTLPIVQGLKYCHRCSHWKKLDDYYPEKLGKGGLRAYCKKCDLKRVNGSVTNNLSRALRNLWIGHKTVNRRLTKRRQEMRQVSCITHEFLELLWEKQGGRCAVTQVPMTHIQGEGYGVMTNVTIDRIDNSIGYVPDNVRLVCRAVNYMKASMSDAEMVQWAAMILRGPIGNKDI